MAVNKLSIVSYNAQGLGAGRLEYIKDLCNENYFICIQEHWLLPTNTHAFNVAFPAINSHVITGMQGHELITGRPYGGCAILWKKNIQCIIEPVTCTSNRLCLLLATLNNMKIAICSLYMPCDNSDDITYNDILNEIIEKCASINVNNIIIAGDYNTDLSRITSKSTKSLNDFMQSHSFTSGLRKFPTINYTFESKINSHKSLIDHIIMSDNISNFLIEYNVYHSIDNMSDHSALTGTFNFPITYTCIDNEIHNACKVDWKKASEQQLHNYNEKIETSLRRINVPLDALRCSQLFCTNHQTALSMFYNSIINVCINVADETIPHSNRAINRPIPGWNAKAVEPRENALFWHTLWKSCGSPRQGVVADIRRHTRAKYHYVIRQLKRNKNVIAASQMADSLASNDTCSFWKKVQKCNPKCCSRTGMVENMTDDKDICEVFAEKYEKLYNSVSYEKDAMSDLYKQVNSNIQDICMNNKCHSSHVINVDDVCKAVNKLKLHKRDGKYDVYSNNLIYGGSTLFTYLSMILTSMMNHSFVPDEMLISTLIPIPKDKRKSLNNADNYRSIALGSIVCKLYDNIILENEKLSLKSCDLQFGFKEGFSTTQCTFVVEETINYYKQYKSNVYTVLLDASKAFDKVNYVKLFKLLVKRGMCSLTIRHILTMYINQKLCVNWSESNSDYFPISNGVKQGGILSPVLFTVYMDELLNRLKHSGVGCYIGNVFCGAVAYADDLTLMAPSKFAIHFMLDICKKYAHDYDVTFNPHKSQLLIYNDIPNVNHFDLKMNNESIIVYNDVKHLGTTIGHMPNEHRVHNVVKDLYRRVNHVRNQFKFAHHKTKYQLFKSYCMSLYSSVLLDMDDNSYDMLFVAWRKSIRMLMNLHPQTRSHLLPGICNDRPIHHQMYERTTNFINSLIKCPSNIVNICIKLALHGSSSNTCNNINVLCNFYNIDKHTLIKDLPIQWSKIGYEKFECITNVIKELMEIRDNNQYLDILNITECTKLMTTICICR
jgi:exonuclease III